MKKIFYVLILLIFFIGTISLADTITFTGNSGTTGNLDGYGPYQTGSGGEFTVSPSSNLQWVISLYSSKTSNITLGNPAQPNFQTFCVETTEQIAGWTTYDVIISDRAIAGSVGPQGDPISIGTAYLYYEFAKGTLQGYNYTGTETDREASAAFLQKAIWWLEDEGDYDNNNIYTNLVKSLFINPKVDHHGEYPVAVLNLYTQGHAGDYDYIKQDQLVLVPEPTTMLILGMGLIGTATFLRKRFKK